VARSRNIKPGFFINDELAEIEPLGRLLFIGLWVIADREGRLKDRPKRIKAEVLPFDNCDMDELLNDLHEKGFITRYLVDGCGYIQINNFLKHQNPHPKEAASSIPEMESRENKLQVSDKPIAKNADSLIPHPSSLILSTDSLNHDSAESDETADDPEQEKPAQVVGTESLRFAEKNFGRPLSPTETEDILGWCDTFKTQGSPDPDAIVVAGLKRCVDNNTRKTSYLKGILVDWLNHGVITLDHIASRDEEWNANKERKRKGKPEHKTPPEKYENFYL
jgi:DnaD/phage-associated family protein